MEINTGLGSAVFPEKCSGSSPDNKIEPLNPHYAIEFAGNKSSLCRVIAVTASAWIIGAEKLKLKCNETSATSLRSGLFIRIIDFGERLIKIGACCEGTLSVL